MLSTGGTTNKRLTVSHEVSIVILYNLIYRDPKDKTHTKTKKYYIKQACTVAFMYSRLWTALYKKKKKVRKEKDALN